MRTCRRRPSPAVAVGVVLLAQAATMSRAADITLDGLLHDTDPPRRIVYKRVGDFELIFSLFPPADARPGDPRAAAVWIHGGGWTGGSPEAFEPHARYFARRGAVGITIEYRLLRAGGPTAAEAFADCKSAIRFLRAHAGELGIDPARVAVLGDSAGGHLAACLATIDGFDDPSDDLHVSAVPDAAVLYNPITDLTDGTWWYAVVGPLPKGGAAHDASPEVLARARNLSPVAHVAPHRPPTLVMHGLLDKVVPAEQSKRFVEAMRAAGNRCELTLVPDAKHAFVCTRYTAPNETVVAAICAGDRFLTSLGFLSGEPTLRP